MKPQTAAFLDKARELLDQGNTMMDVHLNEAASRAAYLAAMHAALKGHVRRDPPALESIVAALGPLAAPATTPADTPRRASRRRS